MFFCETGKTGQNSIFDAVYNLAEAVTVSNWHHFLMAGLFALSIIVLLLIPSPGILFLILAMFITMRDYYKYKRPVEKYIISCGYLLRTLQCAQNMGKLDAPEIREYQQRTVKAAKAFGKFKRNTFFLMAGSVTDDNILKGLLMYLNVCFHIDLIQFSTIVKEIKQHIGEGMVCATADKGGDSEAVCQRTVSSADPGTGEKQCLRPAGRAADRFQCFREIHIFKDRGDQCHSGPDGSYVSCGSLGEQLFQSLFIHGSAG